MNCPSALLYCCIYSKSDKLSTGSVIGLFYIVFSYNATFPYSHFQRLKFVGMLHRDKRTPGQFMLRLKVPNGIVNSDQMRFYADCVEKYGEERGVIDITTRQNIQLRGVKIEDAPDIIDGLHARNQTSFQSALDSVRNMVGSPLAGIDEKEMVDTREFCNALNDLVSLDPVTQTRGNPMWGNLPRKFNIAVSGSRDDFSHTHINDIGLQPCPHAATGEMGFNVVLGVSVAPFYATL